MQGRLISDLNAFNEIIRVQIKQVLHCVGSLFYKPVKRARDVMLAVWNVLKKFDIPVQFAREFFLYAFERSARHGA